MNPTCGHDSCQGECVCIRKGRIEHFTGFFSDKGWVFWAVTVGIAYALYTLLMAHAVMVPCAC